MSRVVAKYMVLLVVLAVVLPLSSCGDGTTRMLTTFEDLVDTPKPPNQWYPFSPKTDQNPNGKEPGEYVNKFPMEEPDSQCKGQVARLEVMATGPIKGNLKFNTKIRGNIREAPDYTYPETNQDNTDLGGVRTGNLYLYYKYQVELTWSGDPSKVFYGQYISNQLRVDKNDEVVTFYPWTPENDTPEREWNIKTDQPVKEFKKKYPVVEKDDKSNTITYIDVVGGAGGSFGIGTENKKYYLWIYAGACDKVTAMKLYKVDFTEGKLPSMREVKPENFLKEVKSFSFTRASKFHI